jgi:hypothetical protein
MTEMAYGYNLSYEGCASKTRYSILGGFVGSVIQIDEHMGVHIRR